MADEPTERMIDSGARVLEPFCGDLPRDIVRRIAADVWTEMERAKAAPAPEAKK